MYVRANATMFQMGYDRIFPLHTHRPASQQLLAVPIRSCPTSIPAGNIAGEISRLSARIQTVAGRRRSRGAGRRARRLVGRCPPRGLPVPPPLLRGWWIGAAATRFGLSAQSHPPRPSARISSSRTPNRREANRHTVTSMIIRDARFIGYE